MYIRQLALPGAAFVIIRSLQQKASVDHTPVSLLNTHQTPGKSVNRALLGLVTVITEFQTVNPYNTLNTIKSNHITVQHCRQFIIWFCL